MYVEELRMPAQTSDATNRINRRNLRRKDTAKYDPKTRSMNNIKSLASSEALTT